MHAPIHPNRKAIVDFLNIKRDKFTVEKVEAYNHYPKDPFNPKDNRIYMPNIGGCLLDLGVYVI